MNLHAMFTRNAVTAIGSWAGRDAKAQKDLLGAIRGLPLLLRRHGLVATAGHLMNKGRAHEGEVAEAFVHALAGVCKFNATESQGQVEELASEPLAAYLLHSRLALAQADAWVHVAESVLVAAGRAARQDGADGAASDREVMNAGA